MKHNEWINEEIDLLKSLYGNVKLKELIVKFPRHTRFSISKKANNLKLRW